MEFEQLLGNKQNALAKRTSGDLGPLDRRNWKLCEVNDLAAGREQLAGAGQTRMDIGIEEKNTQSDLDCRN